MNAYDKTSIQINRCKRILALVDDYVEKQDAATRTDLRKTLMEEFEAPVIAPPVAAGSVDTLQIWIQLDGELSAADCSILFPALNAWGEQQREAGRREMFAEVEEKNAILAAKVEKAEAELAQVNQWYRTAHQINEDLAARILKADDRIEELETEIKVLHRG